MIGTLGLIVVPLLLASAPISRREVAITIDDLPFAQSGKGACEFKRLRASTDRLLAPIRARHVPVTAFAIAGSCASLSYLERRTILRSWIAAGAEIGNHTYSHQGLNSIPIEKYERDILRAEPILKDAIAGRTLRYFRSPMLQTGPDRATAERLETFLAAHGYRQAPVTFDNSDWMFAYVVHQAAEDGDQALQDRARSAYIPYMESVVAFFERRSIEVVGREFPQVLLIHANDLNAEALPRLLDMFERRGYRFVTLDWALKDDAYKLPNGYAGPGGFSWIHRWSITQGMPNKGEPEEPAWLRDAYEKMGTLSRHNQKAQRAK